MPDRVAGRDRAGSPGFGAESTTKLVARLGESEDQIRAPPESLSAIGQTLGLDVLPVGEASLSELRVRPDYAIVLSTSPMPVGYLEVK